MSKIQLMKKIASEVRVCVKCPLWQGRKNAVPGAGSINSSTVFVGEAPGHWEDVKGLPFVGAAGRVLDTLLEEIGLPREDVFITNVVKCRPPGNRPPKRLEIETCASLYLSRQISLIKPKLVVTLGRCSTAYVLSKAGFGKIESMTQLRGKVYDVKFLSLAVTVVPMYHPASVLHNPGYQDELDRDFHVLGTELKKRRIV